MSKFLLVVFGIFLKYAIVIDGLQLSVPKLKNVRLSLASPLQKLISIDNEIKEGSLSASLSPQFVFVGGKGGVGKTTSSSAIAIALANSGFKTLLVSTDPAHSLGDALDYKLPLGKTEPIVTQQNLWALEIDIGQEMKSLKKQLDEISDDSIAQLTGLPPDVVASFGLADFAAILSNPPPGIDEIISLSKIFEYSRELKEGHNEPAEISAGPSHTKFDRIVIDTAPTGHTLRLLQLPEFLNTFALKLLDFKKKFSGVISMFGSFLGDGRAEGFDRLFSMVDKLTSLQSNMLQLSQLLKNRNQTQFVVVTIPTKLALDESRRLVKGLQNENILVSSIICNQILDNDADIHYLGTKLKAQLTVLNDITVFLSDQHYNIQVARVPYCREDVMGVNGLKFFSSIAHKPFVSDSKPLTIFSGKGGVGKTTSAASWALQLCETGHKTLIISSDPAHSLGDAFQRPLSGEPTKLHSQSEGSTHGELWAMEINADMAIKELKAHLIGDKVDVQSETDMFGMSGISEEMSKVFLDVDHPPPGVDEIVTMVKVMSYLEKGYNLPNGEKVKFDRVVIDTAPTGHTLKMLQLPMLLQKMMNKMRSVRDKFKMFSRLFAAFGVGGKRNVDASEDRLQSFQQKMQQLETVLHDPSKAEFVVVTIPTNVAMAETKRLLHSLSKDKFPLRRLIVNQLLPMEPLQSSHSAEFASSYVRDVRENQQRILKEIEEMGEKENISLIKIPFCEHEAKSVFVLRYIAQFIFPSISFSN